MESCLLKFNLLFHPGGYTWDKYDDGDDDGSLALNANDVPGSFLTTSCVLVAVESLSHVWLSHARLTCPSLSPRICSNSCPLSWWCYPTVSSSVTPSPPALHLSQHQGLFQWVSSLYQVAKVLELQLQQQPSQWLQKGERKGRSCRDAGCGWGWEAAQCRTGGKAEDHAGRHAGRTLPPGSLVCVPSNLG